MLGGALKASLFLSSPTFGSDRSTLFVWVRDPIKLALVVRFGSLDDVHPPARSCSSSSPRLSAVALIMKEDFDTTLPVQRSRLADEEDAADSGNPCLIG